MTKWRFVRSLWVLFNWNIPCHKAGECLPGAAACGLSTDRSEMARSSAHLLRLAGGLDLRHKPMLVGSGKRNWTWCGYRRETAAAAAPLSASPGLPSFDMVSDRKSVV